MFTSYSQAAHGFLIDGSVATSSYGFLIQSFNTSLTGVGLTLYSTSIFQSDATTGGGVTLRGSGDTHTAYNSALFSMKSTTKGFLPPRMTTTEKNAIASPDAGLVLYDTTLNKLCVFTTAWETVTSV
jgi:hypothetical protein